MKLVLYRKKARPSLFGLAQQNWLTYRVDMMLRVALRHQSVMHVLS
jgi:hypothetical protein